MLPINNTEVAKIETIFEDLPFQLNYLVCALCFVRSSFIIKDGQIDPLTADVVISTLAKFGQKLNIKIITNTLW